MKKRILIVEDSPAMRRLIALAIGKDPDIEVVEASDGLEALKILTQGKFDLAFVDINMPVLDGIRFLQRVRGDNLQPTMKVAMCTTEGANETENEARDAGAEYFLRKPINRRDIERVLFDALR
jgi:two-component system chemotaxis response regulator CheY